MIYCLKMIGLSQLSSIDIALTQTQPRSVYTTQTASVCTGFPWVWSRGCLTDGLHGVSLLDEQLSSGDVDVHPQRLLLLVHRVRGPRILTGRQVWTHLKQVWTHLKQVSTQVWTNLKQVWSHLKQV